MSKATLKAWFQASRPPFYIATLIPLLLGTVIAARETSINYFLFFLILLASFFVHLATNLANDFFERKTDNAQDDVIGGSRVIQEGKIKSKHIFLAIVVLYALSLVLGLMILSISKVLLLIPIVLFAAFSSIFYTAKPIRYGYHGLGEVFVGINMGPIMVAGTHLALTGHFALKALLLSIPVALMVALILYFQSLPDIEADRRIKKMTLAVILTQNKAILGYRAFVILSLLSILALILAGLLKPIALLCIATLIPAYVCDRRIKTSLNWLSLHGKGMPVRLFYLLNGALIILAVSA